MSYTSKYTGPEIDSLLDKVNKGEVVTELDSAYCCLEDRYSPVVGEIVPFTMRSGNMKVTDGKITVKPGQRVQISVVLSYYNTASSRGCVGFELKDITNNIQIQIINPNIQDPKYEHGFSTVCQYTNTTDKDCEIGLSAYEVYIASTRLNTISSITVHEIGRVMVVQDDSAPTGNIISFMGTKAPKGYLICDGAEYNIVDYPKLANHFAEQFENIAYFGGDGVNTFKVPDLRNEFLRGYGELSEDIGLHQDATQHTGIYVSNYGKTIYCPNYDYANIGNTNKATNTDSEITNADLGTDASKYQIAGQDGGYTSIVGSQYATSVAKYTSRPTNVAVLYCIKY